MAIENRLNATFFAFRKREKSGVLLSASVAFVVLSVVILGAVAAIFFSALAPVAQWYGQVVASAGDPGAIENLGLPPNLGLAMLVYFGVLFVYFVLFAAYEAGCLRWLIRGEREGLFGLSLGADTWRVYAGYWLWLVILIALYIAIALVTALLVGVGAVAGGDNPGLAIGLGALAPLLALALFAFFLVRLAPAAATSIARRKFSFFQAWTVTRGRFWALLGSIVLIWLIYLAFSVVLTGLLMGAVFGGLDLSQAASDPAAFNQAYYANLGALFGSAAGIALFVGVQLLSWVAGLVFAVLLFGVNARAAIAAIEDGKIDGVLPETARAFE